MAISKGPAVWRRSGVRAEAAHRLARTGGCARPVRRPWVEPLQLEETLEAVPRAYPAGPSKWPFLGARPFQLASVWRAGGGCKASDTYWRVHAARVQPMGLAFTNRGDGTLNAVPRAYPAGPSKWPFLGARPFGVGRACGRRRHTIRNALAGAHGPSAAHGLSPYSSRRRSKRSRAHIQRAPRNGHF